MNKELNNQVSKLDKFSKKFKYVVYISYLFLFHLIRFTIWCTRF